jgi:succinate dehydrogenase / fumarate reductase flavoprotein subunit
MIRTLQDHGIHRGIEVHMEVCVLALLKDGARVCAAFGYDRERGRFRIFRAKAVILATGGIGKAYKITSNSWDCTGDGHALAYHAGAELIDMEYIQFHPTGMVWPPSVRGMLVTEGVRGEGGILTNKEVSASCSISFRITTRRRRPTTKKKAGVIRRATRTRAARRSC